MSEIISKVTGNNLNPNLRKRYLEVRQVKETGRIVIYGVRKSDKKQEKLGYKSFIESFGEKSNKQEPKNGIWNSGGVDRAVTVVGAYDDKSKKGETYLKIKDSKTGIPASQVKWESSNAATNNPDHNKNLENDNSRLRVDNEWMKKENEKLTAKVKKLEDRLAELENKMHEPDILPPAETEAVPGRADPPPPASNRWGNLKDMLTGRRAHAYLVTREPIDDNIRRETRVEESNDHRGLRTIGAVALAAVAVGVAYWMVNKHGYSHDVINNYYDGNNHPVASNGLLPSKFPNHGIQPWDSANNNPGVGISLPDDGHLRIVTDSQGQHDLVNMNTNKIDIDNIQLTNAGAVSQDSLDQAAQHGVVKIGQEHLEYWDNSGPTLNPKLPSAANPGANTHTVTVLSES